jgi:1-deoxy-D-xylulose-5-phosphate reductoisomerase
MDSQAPSPAPRRVVLLGATGSIGRQAVDVIARFPHRFQVVGVVAGRDLAGLRVLAERFGAARVAVVAPDPGAEVPHGWGIGLEAACELAAMPADVVCVAITGAAALRPTLAAIDAGTTVATATKEVLVMAGEIVRARSRRSGSRLLPIDSEHSALWQCLRGEDPASVSRLILTASGGPFRERDPASFPAITPEEALRHPTWRMGPKVTIDSATMMNKGLEVIEAHELFGVPFDDIDVVVHPQSVVHSMVEFRDGAVVAQLSMPDMRLPIGYALMYPDRLAVPFGAIDWTELSHLDFEQPDRSVFTCLELAYRAGRQGDLAPAWLNAANEVAVAAFLDGRIGWCAIADVVDGTLDAYDAPGGSGLGDDGEPWRSIGDILEADASARRAAERAVAARGLAA